MKTKKRKTMMKGGNNKSIMWDKTADKTIKDYYRGKR